jgi:hypothetical protein
VKAVLAGAFQWVSAHLAVDAIGGRFWQLMLAERAVQAACGPERKVKIFADQDGTTCVFRAWLHTCGMKGAGFSG